MGSVIFVSGSKNAKIGDVAATYAPIKQTCPSSCKLRDNGCYAQLSMAGIHNAKIEKEASNEKATAYELAVLEAKLIANHKPKPKQGLRIHVSGDSRTVRDTKQLARAAQVWISKGGSRPWSYTHAWKKVPRKAWGNVSCLASVENLTDAKTALETGYAAALVVSEHPADGRSERKEGMLVIPCPAQTRNVSCEQCKLCWRDDFLLKSQAVISFAAHGRRKKKMTLNVLK